MINIRSFFLSVLLVLAFGIILTTEGKVHNVLKDEFDCPEHWGYYEDPENCIKYYHCEDGVAESITCRIENGIQLLYDHENNWCNWPEVVDCGSRPICDQNNENCKEEKTTSIHHETTTMQTQVTKDDGDFQCQSLWGYYPDPKNCIKYYICSNGIPERMTCRKENEIQLHYNAPSIACDWPQNVDCGTRPICDERDQNCEENDKSTSKPTGPTQKPTPSTQKPADPCKALGPCSSKENGQLKPIGECENSFCECANFEYWQIFCPSGLVFNAELNWCDWPEHTPGCQ